MRKNKVGGNQNRFKYFISSKVGESSTRRCYFPKSYDLEITLNSNRIGIYFKEDLEHIKSFYRVKINP